MELRKPNKKLRSMLYAHKKWIAGNPKARPLDLRGADLGWLDLAGRDLRGANFSRANFEGANLRGSKLMGCNLSGANLHRVKLDGADMSFAIMRRCFAAYVAFKGVVLKGCDIEDGDFSGATFKDATFGDDQESRLFCAKFNIVPDGEIFGWKKLRDGRVAKLLIPTEAQRSSGFSRRCRAEFALVLGILDKDGLPHDEGISKRDPNLKYLVGQTVRADGWDVDWKNECSPGINFFITREEAEAY